MDRGTTARVGGPASGPGAAHRAQRPVGTRAGIGQIRVAIEVVGALYGRVAGDGVVVATALGSSAYSLAAGGPVLYLHPDVARVVRLPGQEPLISVLRDRGVIRDSPRILAEGRRTT